VTLVDFTFRLAVAATGTVLAAAGFRLIGVTELDDMLEGEYTAGALAAMKREQERIDRLADEAILAGRITAGGERPTRSRRPIPDNWTLHNGERI